MVFRGVLIFGCCISFGLAGSKTTEHENGSGKTHSPPAEEVSNVDAEVGVDGNGKPADGMRKLNGKRPLPLKIEHNHSEIKGLFPEFGSSNFVVVVSEFVSCKISS